MGPSPASPALEPWPQCSSVCLWDGTEAGHSTTGGFDALGLKTAAVNNFHPDEGKT